MNWDLGKSPGALTPVRGWQKRFFRPVEPCTEEAEQVHGRTSAWLANKPQFTQQDARKLQKLFEGCQGIIAHKLDWDLQCLQNQFLRVGFRPLKVPSTQWCTVKLAEQHGYSYSRSRLSWLAENLLEQPQVVPHNADSDVLLAAKLFQHFT